MKRLGVFVFYNSEGIVRRYVEILLESLFGELDEIVVVVNGKITKEAMQKLQKYSDRILVRPNNGYDGGAYKDVFLSYLDRNYISQWDEMVLFNDTFFAPIFPWKPVFDKMKEVQTDFWGLTAYPGGAVLSGRKEPLPYHLQGYFIVCRKNLFMDDAFYAFWEQLDYPASYSEAVLNYEINFTTYMRMAGYKGISYVEACNAEHLLEYGKNPYVEKAKELLEEIRLPILKRKFFNIQYFSLCLDVMDFLREKSDYDIELIEKDIRRMELDDRTIYQAQKLKQFCEAHERIYIYGHGRYGTGVADYLTYKNISYEGFLVSKKGGEEADNVYQYGDVSIGEKDGVILGLGRDALKAVYPDIKDQFGEDQLFLPNF